MIDGLPGLLFLLAFLAILAGCAVTVRHDDKRRELDVYERLRGGGGGLMRTPVGTTAALLAEAWFALVAALDRVLAWFPRRWDR